MIAEAVALRTSLRDANPAPIVTLQIVRGSTLQSASQIPQS